MNNLTFLIRRNLSLFIENKMNILLSLASIPIIIGLYVLFLRDFLLDTITLTGMNQDLIHEFTDRFMLSGLLVVINTTTCFGVIQICVNDSALGIKRDYMIAPISAFKLTVGYWFSSILISAFFTSATIIGCEVFFAVYYESMFRMSLFLKALGSIFFSSCINSAILLCFAKNLKNTTTFSTFANLYGTLIGFLAGAYLPYYFYPSWLKSILFYFPPTQMTSILRQIYLEPITLALNLDQSSAFSKELYQRLAIYMEQNHNLLSIQEQWSNLFLSAVVLLIILRFISIDLKQGSK